MTPEQLKEKQAAMSDNDLIDLVLKQISKLAKTGGASHTMCVPPEITDTDMLLCELVKRFEKSNLVIISKCDHGYKGPNKHDKSCELYCGMKKEDYEFKK